MVASHMIWWLKSHGTCTVACGDGSDDLIQIGMPGLVEAAQKLPTRVYPLHHAVFVFGGNLRPFTSSF